MVASKSPELLSFPLHHSGGTGFSTLGDGKKAGIHRIMFHSARDAALARLLVSLHVPACRYRCAQRTIWPLRPVFDLDLGVGERYIIYRNAIFCLAIRVVGSDEHIGQGILQEVLLRAPTHFTTGQDGCLDVSTCRASQEQLRTGLAHVRDDV